MYSCLYCLKHFAGADYVGEKAYFITTLAAAAAHLQQLEVERVYEDDAGADGGRQGPCHSYRVRPPPTPRKDSGGGGGEAEPAEANGGGVEEDLLERWGPVFEAAETRRALEYLDGWLAMELNMEETIELLETGGWW